MSNAVSQASYRVEVDVKRVNELLSRLNDKEAKKAIKAGIRKSALIIRKQAQSNLVSAVPGASTRSEKGGASFKPLKNEISVAVYRNASGACVNIMNHGKKGSRAFLLRMFEAGTVQRVLNGKKPNYPNRATKIGANRGTINATYFFKNAVESKKGEAEKALNDNIINAITKAANKK